MRNGVSACIITYNEEAKISDCLRSVSWADEILVVDSFSTDQTLSLCRTFTHQIYQRMWNGINEQRNYALHLARGPWILSIDADERVSPELAAEIQLELEGEPTAWSGFFMPRHTFYLGRWIDHGGWYPDFKLRLFRKDKGSYEGEDPHDQVVVSGPTKRLRYPLLHYTYDDLSEHLRVVDRFSTVWAQRALERGEKPHLWKLIIRPIVKFVEVYLYKMGFLDGRPGFLIALVTSFYVFLRYAKLWELTHLQPRRSS